MSRQSMAPGAQPRSLTLTEELEKLEQSITLTLQEIDHNFSQAHRIVTSSILPVVEQYARHSDAVWEGSKFWKEFFEASANIRLSKYEEDASGIEDDEGETTATVQQSEASDVTQTPHEGQSVAAVDDSISSAGKRPSSQFDDQLADDLVADSPSLTRRSADQATPKNKGRVSQDSLSSDSHANDDEEDDDDEETQKYVPAQGRSSTPSKSKPPITPGTRSVGSSAVKPSPFMGSTARKARLRDTNPIMHRVLDKNYRIMATPMTKKRAAAAAAATTTAAAATQQQSITTFRNPALDSSPLSPDLAAPELRSDFFSPMRKPATSRTGPRTPGISVLANKQNTPLRNYNNPEAASARKSLFNGAKTHAVDVAQRQGQFDIDWDTDSDDDGGDYNMGMSPPKTMQFAVPSSRLMQTPAKEASKRIVEDLLLTAGAQSVTDEMQDLNVDDRRWDMAHNNDDLDLQFDDSPSVVRMAKDVGDDEF